jgi:NifB/MoaA-like Fe-S oxidoreductase
VAGLLSGSDLAAALSGKDLGETVFISSALLKEGSGLFLDDMTVEQLVQALNVPVRAVSGPVELAGYLAGAVSRRSEPAGKGGSRHER